MPTPSVHPIGESSAPGVPISATPPISDNKVSSGAPVRYVLYYRQGTNPHPLFTFFDYSSKDMKIVVERAKRHCDQMSYRFVNVRPMLVDLDIEEAINRGDRAR